MKTDLVKDEKVCPICHNLITSYPAISRKDDKTEICSECGVKEAITAFENHLKEESEENA